MNLLRISSLKVYWVIKVSINTLLSMNKIFHQIKKAKVGWKSITVQTQRNKAEITKKLYRVRLLLKMIHLRSNKVHIDYELLLINLNFMLSRCYMHLKIWLFNLHQLRTWCIWKSDYTIWISPLKNWLRVIRFPNTPCA